MSILSGINVKYHESNFIRILIHNNALNVIYSLIDMTIPIEIEKAISDLLNDPDVTDIYLTADRTSDTKTVES